MWRAIALSFGLAMDATAVSAARGLAARHKRDLLLLPLVFGGFQSGMSALGWLGGAWAGEYIQRWQGWVAFILLGAIGVKMIVDSVRSGDEEDDPAATTGVGVYLGLGIATSIDAAIAGLTLPGIPVAPWLSVLLIGAITAICSAAGYTGGRALGNRFGAHLGILGGLVLVAIGADSLIQSL